MISLLVLKLLTVLCFKSISQNQKQAIFGTLCTIDGLFLLYQKAGGDGPNIGSKWSKIFQNGIFFNFFNQDQRNYDKLTIFYYSAYFFCNFILDLKKKIAGSSESVERSIFQTFWKDDCVTKSLFFELETSNFGYLLIFFLLSCAKFQ